MEPLACHGHASDLRLWVFPVGDTGGCVRMVALSHLWSCLYASPRCVMKMAAQACRCWCHYGWTIDPAAVWMHVECNMAPTSDLIHHLLIATVNRGSLDRQRVRVACEGDRPFADLVRVCWPQCLDDARGAVADPLGAIDTYLAEVTGAAQDLALLLSADGAIRQRRLNLAAARLDLFAGRRSPACDPTWHIAENFVRTKLSLRRGEFAAAARWLAAAVAAAGATHPEVGDSLRELDVRLRLMTHRWDGCDEILADLARGADTTTGIGHRALLWRAWAAIEQGHAQRALDLIDAHREQPWTYLLRLAAGAQLRRWPWVEDLLAQPPVDDEQDALLLGQRGAVRYLQGRLEEVSSIITRLGQGDPESDPLQSTLHLALHTSLASGRGEQARLLLSRLDPQADLPSFQLEWARLHRLEGDDASAAACFARLVASGRPAYIAWRLRWAHEVTGDELVAWWWPHCRPDRVDRPQGAPAEPRARPTAAPHDESEPILIGEDPTMVEVRHRIALFAPRDEPVLICGETGTGKEIVARSLHRLARPEAPLVNINCAAIPASLAEAELFGHVRGAFTGADRARAGAIAAAGDGVLFLDEIVSLPADLQGVLLRVLETGDYRPVGGDRDRRLRARVIAACHEDPHRAVADGRLRADLFYRLQRLTIDLPPLRRRVDDIEVLARHFLIRFGCITPPDLDPALLRCWQRHSWSGNVRELRNEVERMAVLHGHEACFTVAHSAIAAAAEPTDAPLSPSPEPTSESRPSPVVGAIAKRREQIVRFVREHGHITRKEAIAVTGCAPATAQRDLQALVDSARLRRIRSGAAARFDYFILC